MADEPVLRVEKGEPTDDELAALISAVSAKLASAQLQERPTTWAAYWRSVRAPLTPGPSAWRRSTLPR